MSTRVVITAILALAWLAAAANGAMQPCESVRWHVRASAPDTSPARLTMTWNDGRGRLEVDVPAMADDDPVAGCLARYTYSYADSVMGQGTVPVQYLGGAAALSVVLKADAAGAVAEIGASRCAREVPVVYDCLCPGEADASLSSGMLLRNDMLVRHLPAPMLSRFASVDSLMAYLGAATDPAEGLWRYLDRDTPPDKAVPGGYYTLATVADGDGGYEIVYLDGSQYHPEAWQPLRLKGRLHPSGFAGNYDLEWHAADGRACPPESYATLDSDTGILALFFPLLNSTLRFRRLR